LNSPDCKWVFILTIKLELASNCVTFKEKVAGDLTEMFLSSMSL
jgi:hypothetical protein